jgi:hypothetical protein
MCEGRGYEGRGYEGRGHEQAGAREKRGGSSERVVCVGRDRMGKLGCSCSSFLGNGSWGGQNNWKWKWCRQWNVATSAHKTKALLRESSHSMDEGEGESVCMCLSVERRERCVERRERCVGNRPGH